MATQTPEQKIKALEATVAKLEKMTSNLVNQVVLLQNMQKKLHSQIIRANSSIGLHDRKLDQYARVLSQRES